jgi:hypothetical protein
MVVHQASANLVANGAMVAVASVISPTKESVVDLATAKTVPPRHSASSRASLRHGVADV